MQLIDCGQLLGLTRNKQTLPKQSFQQCMFPLGSCKIHSGSVQKGALPMHWLGGQSLLTHTSGPAKAQIGLGLNHAGKASVMLGITLLSDRLLPN